jgi:hypothetical protein
LSIICKEVTVPREQKLAHHRPLLLAGRDPRIPCVVLGVVCVATLLGGILCFIEHSHAVAERLLIPAGLALLTSGLVQARLIASAWRNGRLTLSELPLVRFGFWRALSCGAFLAYLAALAVGPRDYVACLWLGAVSLWYTGMLLPLAVSPSTLERWRRWTQNRTARRSGWLLTAAMLLLVVGEASQQARRQMIDGGWFDPSAELVGDKALGSLPAAEVAADDLAAALESSDALDFRVAELRSSSFRVAILGDRAALAGFEAGGERARVERMLPGLEIVPVDLSQPWSIGRPVTLSQRLAEVRPDLALALVSVCDNLAHEPPPASWFDWRQLELAHLIVGDSPAPPAIAAQQAMAQDCDDFESFLRVLAPQLQGCRAPLDEVMRARWQRTFVALDEALVSCRRQRIPMGLVLVPAQFQINRSLCETLVRRAGGSIEQIDVDLPQRSLTGFAERRQLPVLDLLPHLRLASSSLYKPNSPHWNERGAAAAASAMGGWLESYYGGQLALAALLSSTR